MVDWSRQCEPSMSMMHEISPRPYCSPMSNSNVDYSAYFVMRLKEYLLKHNSGNRLMFCLKILLLMNWDKCWSTLCRQVLRLYYHRIYRWLPSLSIYRSFYKTHFIEAEPLSASSVFPKIARKYTEDKSLFCQYNGGPGGYVMNDYGVEFDCDDVHFYLYTDKGKDMTCKSFYILECYSNLSYENTVARVNKMISSYKPDNIYIKDETCVPYAIPCGNDIKIDRKLDCIFLQEEVRRDVSNFINRYEAYKTEYARLGIMYKNIFLVYGEPGTGKSTLAKVVATELKRDIVLFNLKNVQTSNQLLDVVFRNKSSIIVFEELDCLIDRITKRNEQKKAEMMHKRARVEDDDGRSAIAFGDGRSAIAFGDGRSAIAFGDRDKDRHSHMSKRTGNYTYDYPASSDKEDSIELSDFLEILDGMRSIEDSIIFFTTNHIGKIDPAFKRHGRINYLIEMKLCNRYQLYQIYQQVLGREPTMQLIDTFEEYIYSPANVIETMVQHIFELKSGEITDLELLELIRVKHEIFHQSQQVSD